MAVTAPDLCIVAAGEWVLVHRGLYQDTYGNTHNPLYLVGWL